MENNPIRTLAIVGGDCIAWSVAAILRRCSGIKSLRVVVIDSGASIPAGEVKAMNPSLQKFHNLIGIDEKEFMLQTGASFRLANRYGYGESQDQVFIQSFGDHGIPFNNIDFHQHFISSTARALEYAYHSYSLGAVAAAKEKFIRPLEDRKSIYSSFSYGYHLDASRYRDYLRECVVAWGVERISGGYAGVSLCKETGFLRKIILDNGSQIDADFFVDCSGAEELLIGKALNVPYSDFAQYIPVNNHAELTIAADYSLKLSTQWHYKKNFWKKEISLGGSRFMRFFSSPALDDEVIVEEISQKNSGADSYFTRKSVKPGLRKSIWYKNCLSVGSACGYVGEFGVDELELAHFISIKFLDFFPDAYCRPLNTAEFNRAIIRECENIRDFNTLHYFMARRAEPGRGEPAALLLSAELENSLALFAESGIRTGSNDNLISRQQWITYLIEHKFLPAQGILSASLASAELDQGFAQLRNSIARAASTMPDHKEYLERYLSMRAS